MRFKVWGKLVIVVYAIGMGLLVLTSCSGSTPTQPGIGHAEQVDSLITSSAPCEELQVEVFASCMACHERSDGDGLEACDRSGMLAVCEVCH